MNILQVVVILQKIFGPFVVVWGLRRGSRDGKGLPPYEGYSLLVPVSSGGGRRKTLEATTVGVVRHLENCYCGDPV